MWMDEIVLRWILGVMLAMIAGLAKLWWSHIQECRARAVRDAGLRTEVEELQREVGRAHDEGMRKRLHNLETEVFGARIGRS